MNISFVLNGQAVALDAAPDQRAVDLLRGLGALRPDGADANDAPGVCAVKDVKDVKEGCGTGECGACSILVDGVHKLSCLLLAAQLHGREITTASGLGSKAAPHPIQQAFAEHGAVQCGFCSPGMSIAAAALLAENPQPTRDEVRRALSGNLCRCTGYVMIVDAVQAAADAMRCDSSMLHDAPPTLRDTAQASRKAPQAAPNKARKKAGRP